MNSVKICLLCFSDVNDIELFVGGLLEARLPNSYVGETFACILGEQFRALKLGDSYWYEREENGFTEGKSGVSRGSVLFDCMVSQCVSYYFNPSESGIL